MTDESAMVEAGRPNWAAHARVAAVGLLFTLLALAGGAVLGADSFPTANVKLVVPFAAGGGTDTVARVVAQVLSTRLTQPVIVDNRPGGGGSIGTMAVTQAPADGYTLLLGSNGTMVLNPALYPNLKYQVDRDLVPVAGIASMPYLIAVNPQFPAADIKNLLAAARKMPVTFASPGNGTTNHLVGILLQSMAKVEMTHVPYRGASLAMNDVISGQVHFLSGDFGTLLPMVHAGKLRPLAITGPRRVDILPNVPTVAESLPGFDATGWFGIFAPRGTQAAVVEKLSTEIVLALRDPRVTQRLHDLGAVVMSLNSEQMKRLLDAETAKWRKVITDNKVTADALQ